MDVYQKAKHRYACRLYIIHIKSNHVKLLDVRLILLFNNFKPLTIIPTACYNVQNAVML